MDMENASGSCSFLMEPAVFYEDALQAMWNTVPLGIKLPLRSGGSALKVISRGVWNHAAGPDFLNAKLEIDGKEVTGDVEVHFRAADWVRHGHTSDVAYQQVILHVLGADDIIPSAAPGLPAVPVYILPSTYKAKQENTNTTGICSAFFERLSDETLLNFARDAGLDRMKQKANILLADMIERGTAETVLLKLFEQLGVPENRTSFRALAERILAYPEDIRKKYIKVLIWGESGCLPDPAKTELPDDSRKIVCSLWNDWWAVRRMYSEPLQFIRRARPVNSIERRLAMLTAFIDEYGENPLPKMLDILMANPEKEAVALFLEKIPQTDPFWLTHTSFVAPERKTPVALFGRGRILQLLADVLIPAMHAFSGMNGDLRQSAAVESFFTALPKTDSNTVIRRAVELCFPGREAVFHTAAAQQGVIHIYKTWCEKLSCDCRKCTIGRFV